MPVAPLLEFTSLFDIADGTIRTALSRMTTTGELESHHGVYRLSGRLLDRQSQQDEGRANPPDEWNGDWWTAVVLSERRSVSDRRRFRASAQRARLGELRPDTWLRPANIDIPTDLGDVVLTRGELFTTTSEELIGRLWDLETLDRQARSLLTRVEQANNLLRTNRPTDQNLTVAFTALATCLRYLRTEPQLPAELAIGTAGLDLRARYGETEQRFQKQLAAFFKRRGISTAAL